MKKEKFHSSIDGVVVANFTVKKINRYQYLIDNGEEHSVIDVNSRKLESFQMICESEGNFLFTGTEYQMWKLLEMKIPSKPIVFYGKQATGKTYISIGILGFFTKALHCNARNIDVNEIYTGIYDLIIFDECDLSDIKKYKRLREKLFDTNFVFCSQHDCSKLSSKEYHLVHLTK